MVRKLVLVLFAVSSLTVFAREIPKLDRGNNGINLFVTDEAGVLNQSERDQLRRKLFAYQDSTSNEIAILLINSLEGDDIFDFSLRVAREWGVGGKEHSNGVLITVATTDRKTFVHVGDGLEHRIPDALAGRVVDQILIPNFKQTGYYKGLDKAVDRLIQYAAGEYKNDKQTKNGFPTWLIIVIIMIAFIIFSRFGDNSGSTYRGRRGGWVVGPGTGGYIGGGGGGFSGGGFGGFGGGGFSGGGAGGSW
ncbi:MAG: TPM domain-containing protein [Bacteroidia bacterium]|nr:TPM domain-containing protein [Bacteroidia bacterium]